MSGPGQWYGGQVTLTWTGHLDYSMQTASVFRYAEPTRQDISAFASSLGASPEVNGNQQIVGYSTLGIELKVDGTTPEGTNLGPPNPPTFFITINPSPLPTVRGTGLADFAAQYLAQHSLTPQWPYTVKVEGTAVLFLRHVAVPGYISAANVIDSGGRHSGLEVDFTGDKLLRVVGPLPVGLDSTDYPIIPADQAVRAALASSPSPAANAPARPVVHLTKAELVYALAPAITGGYYEPALLFSGTFQALGYTFTKLVLVPLVDPSLLSS